MKRETIAGAVIELGKIARFVPRQVRPHVTEREHYLLRVLEWALRAHDVLSEMDAMSAPNPKQDPELARRVNALLDCD